MKLYIHDDHMEQGNVYMKHLSAMTKEQLHSKADIAGELAGRDLVIARLATALEEAVTKLQDMRTDPTFQRYELGDLEKDLKHCLLEQDLTIYKADSLEYDK